MKKVAATPGRSPRASDLRTLAWTLLLSSPTLDSSTHFTFLLLSSPTLSYLTALLVFSQQEISKTSEKLKLIFCWWWISVEKTGTTSTINFHSYRQTTHFFCTSPSSTNIFVALKWTTPIQTPSIPDMDLLLFEGFVLFKTKNPYLQQTFMGEVSLSYLATKPDQILCWIPKSCSLIVLK